MNKSGNACIYAARKSAPRFMAMGKNTPFMLCCLYWTTVFRLYSCSIGRSRTTAHSPRLQSGIYRVKTFKKRVKRITVSEEAPADATEQSMIQYKPTGLCRCEVCHTSSLISCYRPWVFYNNADGIWRRSANVFLKHKSFDTRLDFSFLQRLFWVMHMM